MMQGQELARFIIGIIGNVLAALRFISPTPTFWRIITNKCTEEFHPYPYIATVINCALWIFYGLPFVHPDSTLVVTVNAFGLLTSLTFIAIFFAYTKNNYRFVIVMFLVAEVIFLAIVAVITVMCFQNHDSRSMFVGIVCDIFGTIMYASPLSVLFQIWRTKSVEFLPFWLCLAGFCNGVCWVAYGFLVKIDPYIITVTGLGALLGLIQLGVYFYYTKYYWKGNEEAF